MANKIMKASEINDFFIYHTDRRTIYSGPFTDKGYVITDAQVKMYTLYSSRFIVPVTVAILMALLTSALIPAIICGLVTFAIFEGTFLYKFLPSLTVIEHFEKPARDTFFVAQAKKYSKVRLIALIVIGGLLAGLIPYNAHSIAKYTGGLLVMNDLIAAGMAVYVVLMIITYVRYDSLVPATKKKKK